MRISSFLQTPFISHEDKNMVYISVEDWDLCNPYCVDIFVDGNLVYSEKIFALELSAMIPCYSSEHMCIVRLTPFEDLPVESEHIIFPQKHWKIPLLYSSHEDLGYCAYIEKLHYECYEYLKKAIELCLKHKGFKYMVEHFWWLDAFDTYASSEEKQVLKELIAKNKIEINAIHSGVHTSWADSEQLVRQMYFGCIEAKEKYGASPKCVFYTDISGATSSIINAYSQMGIKYVGLLANSFRNSNENEKIPPIFWWKEKTGENKLLLWQQRSYRAHGLSDVWCDTKRQYPEGEFFFDTTKRIKTEKWFSEKISKLDRSVGHDILPISFYDDREMPTTMLLTVCEEMNRAWKYPSFYIETPSVFMEEIEKSYGDKLPVLVGEISDQWADFATIAPNMMAKKRKAMRLCYDVEILSALGSLKGISKYKKNVFRDVYFGLSEFDEHCWATSSKHPQAMHRHNLQRVKREPIDKAYKELNELLNESFPVADNEKLSVISTLPTHVKSHIRVNSTNYIPKLKHQILPDNTVVTETIELSGVEIKPLDGIIPYAQSNKVDIESFETDYYHVCVNKQTKKIVSILDKLSGRECIDRTARYELGQFIYVNSEKKDTPNLSYEVPKKKDFDIYEGEVAYVIVQSGYEEQSGAITKAQFIFYKHEREIDVDLSYENALGLIGDFYDRYKKNYFFALPFKISKPEFYTELAVGEKNEKEDIIPLNANDFTIVQNWLAVENKDGGIAVYTRDMPVFHLGSIRYNSFKTDFNESQSHVYLYASSNRCNNLLYTSPSECSAKYHLSILPYVGKHSEIVPPWSNKMNTAPIICKRLDFEGKLLSLSNENVRLTSIKVAENSNNALIIRLIETAGKEQKCEIELPFEPKFVMYASNDEVELEKANYVGNKISVKCSPYSYTTIKAYVDFD